MPLRRCIVLLLPVFAAYPQTVDFVKEVQPVLTARCMGCHSGDGAQAGLKAHTREDLLKGGKSGPAIIPGKGADSLIVRRMQGVGGLRMPPSGPPVPAETIERIRQWIDAGAKFDGVAPVTTERIAPLAPRTPEVPAGNASNPIDRFIDSYFAEKHLTPGKVVGDALFARRAWLDIKGLPPTPEELAAFTKSADPDKRAKAIDNLLEDRRAYAEHWISYWNDLLRNDEGVVYHGERKSITGWLVGALEKNMPLDDMVRALLNPPAKSGSEGFLTGITWRGVVSASQTPPMQAAQNAAQVFLGMNLKCAACHDSFINRWKLKDTFGLAGMFAEDKLEMVRCDLPLGAKAEPRFPFPELKVAFDESLESRRHAAAEWFVHKENGRFARTMVNRYWRHLLGRGIVEPVDDMDAEPWNQDLLDWLASDFVAHGYDLQHLMRQIMTSRAYQTEAVKEEAESKNYVFRGPRLRRISAEQFEDSLSAATGDWRVNSPRTDTHASYTREWKLKSDPLSRALGRPIRDQVYTERSTVASTLQALELTNGPLLSKRLERAAKALQGQLPPPVANLFDSKVVRSGSVPVDIDITGLNDLHLLIEDVDSYDPARVVARWADAEFVGPKGTVPVQVKQGIIPAAVILDVKGKGYTRFRARAEVDERSRKSDISPAVRFFVFPEAPDPDHLIRVQGDTPAPLPPQHAWKRDALTDRLYTHLLSRAPTPAERKTAAGMPVEDLLWALLMSPEFQFIH